MSWGSVVGVGLIGRIDREEKGLNVRGKVSRGRIANNGTRKKGRVYWRRVKRLSGCAEEGGGWGGWLLTQTMASHTHTYILDGKQTRSAGKPLRMPWPLP